jgi:hypothetical protein
VIQKISRPGGGFRGLLNYVLSSAKEPEIVTTGDMTGENARALAREFAVVREGNPAVAKPVFHASLSVDPGTRLSAGQWREIAKTYLERLGYGDSFWVAVRHQDKEHDHIHLIASRVSHAGRRVADHQERRRGEEIVRELEEAHGLRSVAPSREAPRVAVSRGELAAFERTGQVSVKARLQEHVAVAARERPNFGVFAERLDAQGVSLRLQTAANGRVSGISFELEGVVLKGSDLGRAFSWQGLARHYGIAFDRERDLSILRALGSSRGERIERPEGPMPELGRPVAAYREAALLHSHLELHQRSTRLAAERKIAAELFPAKSAPAPAGPTREGLELRESRVLAGLEGVFRDPSAARGRLVAFRERHGLEAAGRLLAERPEELGGLRGAALGPWRSQGREEAFSLASALGSELRSVGVDRSRLAVPEPGAPSSPSPTLRLGTLLARLPPLHRIEAAIHRAAGALGAAALSGISATAVNVAGQIALRMAREAGRNIGSARSEEGIGR